MNTIWARNVPHAFAEGIHLMKLWGVEEDSRNGKVLTSEDPVLLQINSPRERVLFDEKRDCNPFFHVMEVVWMLAGENDVRWIEQFNRGFRNYADPGSNTLHGAYGHRWIRHFGNNQIQKVADMLRSDPNTRRAVISMWDPRVDLSSHSDIPCNTSIMFRVIGDSLDMTVINRSNDMIWGMLGANAVHMTYLHELIAFMSGYKIGLYKVFTNNLHIYTDRSDWPRLKDTILSDDKYREGLVEPYPLLQDDETYVDLVDDCSQLMQGPHSGHCRTSWMAHVAGPMHQVYTQRLLKMEDKKDWIGKIQATDWRLACEQYINRREKEKSK